MKILTEALIIAAAAIVAGFLVGAAIINLSSTPQHYSVSVLPYNYPSLPYSGDFRVPYNNCSLAGTLYFDNNAQVVVIGSNQSAVLSTIAAQTISINQTMPAGNYVFEIVFPSYSHPSLEDDSDIRVVC